MSDFLDAIRPEVVETVAAARAAVPESELAARIGALPAPRETFLALAARPAPFVIAEFKRASPSAGAIAPRADLERIVAGYETAGAAAVSVLTEGRHFRGSLDDLARARRATALPILRKDFVLDRYQLLESRAAGADLVLLIAAFLPGDALTRLHADALALGLLPLVEVHDAAELARALSAGARLVGVNNRNLRTLNTALSTAEDLLPSVPRGVLALAESGMGRPRDVRRAFLAGADGVLVGQALMAGGDPAAALRRLALPGPWVKICGMRSFADASGAAAAGADAVGFVLADSPRRVHPEQARAFGDGLPADTERIGVCVDMSVGEMLDAADRGALTGLQLHGAEPPEAVSGLRREGLLVMKGFSAGAEGAGPGPAEAPAYAAAGAVAVLDGRLGRRPDGRGAPAGAAAVGAYGGRRFVLAGGLTPDNVADAVRAHRPAGVDVSGGVEVSGRTDLGRMREFVRRAREA